MRRNFKQVDSGTTRSVWAVDDTKSIFSVYRGRWRKISGNLDHVSAGQSGVWGIFLKGGKGWIFYRVGVSKRRPLGLRWKKLDGSLQQIDSGPRGIVCGTNAGKVYCRRAISRQYPFGREWVYAGGASFKYISVGEYGMWGVSKSDYVYFRQGMSRNRPWGYRWKKVSGRLRQIEAGKFGQLYGVTETSQMYVRTGITEKKPWGKGWKRIARTSAWKHVSIGIGVVYALDSSMNLLKSNPIVVSGKCSQSHVVKVLIVYSNHIFRNDVIY